jgi:hypothetical protein
MHADSGCLRRGAKENVWTRMKEGTRCWRKLNNEGLHFSPKGFWRQYITLATARFLHFAGRLISGTKRSFPETGSPLFLKWKDGRHILCWVRYTNIILITCPLVQRLRLDRSNGPNVPPQVFTWEMKQIIFPKRFIPFRMTDNGRSVGTQQSQRAS